MQESRVSRDFSTLTLEPATPCLQAGALASPKGARSVCVFGAGISFGAGTRFELATTCLERRLPPLGQVSPRLPFDRAPCLVIDAENAQLIARASVIDP